MFKKILAPIDGSQYSIDALDVAAKLADQDNAELLVVSALEPIPSWYPIYTVTTNPSYMAIYMEHQRKSFETLHEKQVKRLNEKYPELVKEFRLVEGKAAQVIVKLSEDFDLVVMGHKGQGGIMDWMLGSVAKKVVDTVKVPVLVVKSEEDSEKSLASV